MRVSVPDHLVSRPFQGETVLLNLRTNRYHGLNPTGARILELLRETGDTAATADRLAAEYGRPAGEVARDVEELCAALAERGLVEVEDAG
jgi:Coenzyme PQQ synthesis protein D (PqqD)